MKTINFDNNYPKLAGQKRAVLLAVINQVPGQLLRGKFSHLANYDTRRDDGRFYHIEMEQEYILLLFQGNKGILFTSLRKANEENIRKYNDSIGESFLIYVEK